MNDLIKVLQSPLWPSDPPVSLYHRVSAAAFNESMITCGSIVVVPLELSSGRGSFCVAASVGTKTVRALVFSLSHTGPFRTSLCLSKAHGLDNVL